MPLAKRRNESMDKEPSKNLVFGSPEKFKAALDEILEENKEGLEKLSKS
jgi:hypothetical protein